MSNATLKSQQKLTVSFFFSATLFAGRVKCIINHTHTKNVFWKDVVAIKAPSQVFPSSPGWFSGFLLTTLQLAPLSDVSVQSTVLVQIFFVLIVQKKCVFGLSIYKTFLLFLLYVIRFFFPAVWFMLSPICFVVNAPPHVSRIYPTGCIVAFDYTLWCSLCLHGSSKTSVQYTSGFIL